MKLESTAIYIQVCICKLKAMHTLAHLAKVEGKKRVDWEAENDDEPD